MNIGRALYRGPIGKNRLTLWAKFFVDTLRGRNSFLFHGRKVATAPKLSADHPQTILMPSAFYLDRGLAWQTTIGKALEVRGHRVIFMPLDIHFPRRNTLYFDDQDWGFATPYFNLYTSTLLYSFRFDVQPYSQFGNAKKFSSNRKFVSTFTYEECEAFTYRDLPLGKMARNPLIHYFRCSVDRRDTILIDAYRDYLAIGMVLVDILTHAYERIKPHVVFIVNGTFLDSSIQVALAIKYKVRIITYEAGFMLNSLMLGIHEPIITFPMVRYLPEQYSSYRLNKQQNEQLDAYLDIRRHGKESVFDYWGKPVLAHESVRQHIGVPDGVTPDVLFTNLLWDSAMLDCDIAFQSQTDWIIQTINWYKNHPDRMLLIRIHPAEVTPPHLESSDKVGDTICRHFPQLPSNIKILPPTSTISSYPLTEISDLVLVYSSTAGLEGAIMGKPVLVAGKTHYRGQGFTNDITRTEEYLSLLEKHQQQTNGDIVNAARKYAYFFFFGYNIPFPLVQEQAVGVPGESVRYQFTSEDLLLPGRDEYLDFICSTILGETDYRSRLSKLIL